MSGPDVLVDTNVFVSARNRREPGSGACRRFLDAVDRGEFLARVSVVTVAELRAGLSPEEVPHAWRAILTHFLTSPHYRVEPIDADLAEAGGSLRATARVALPDALIVATGLRRGVSCLVSQDRELAHKPVGLPVRAPEEMLRR